MQVAGPCPSFGPALANSSDFPRRRSDPPILVADWSRSATRIISQSKCWLQNGWDILRGPPAWSGDPTSPYWPGLALRLQFLELSARLVRVEIVDGRPFKGDPRPRWSGQVWCKSFKLWYTFRDLNRSRWRSESRAWAGDPTLIPECPVPPLPIRCRSDRLPTVTSRRRRSVSPISGISESAIRGPEAPSATPRPLRTESEHPAGARSPSRRLRGDSKGDSAS